MNLQSNLTLLIVASAFTRTKACFHQRQCQQRIYTIKTSPFKTHFTGQTFGFSLAETRRLFELYDADNSSAAQLQKVLELISEKKVSLKQMEDINVLLTELSGLEQRCQDELEAIQQSTSKVHSRSRYD